MEVIELTLTPEQVERVRPLIRAAVQHRSNVLFVSSVAPCTVDGQPSWRWQIAPVSLRTGQKLLKLIQEDEKLPVKELTPSAPGSFQNL
jgi:hypothetical protein